MQKLKMALLLIVVVTVMLICAVFLKLSAHRQDIKARSPLTIEEINRVAAKWGTAPQANPSELSHSTPAQTYPGQTAEPRTEEPPTAETPSTAGDGPLTTHGASSTSTEPPAFLHPPLRRTLTQAEKKDIAARRQQASTTRFGKLTGSTVEFMATALMSAGLDRGTGGMHLSEAADIAYWNTGDWETAKRLYRQALDYPPYTKKNRQECYLRLAWMEDDPQVADRLLELACPTNDESPYVLVEATSLAQLTGSRELFDYYLARLQELNPQLASQFRSYPPMPEDNQTPNSSVPK